MGGGGKGEKKKKKKIPDASVSKIQVLKSETGAFCMEREKKGRKEKKKREERKKESIGVNGEGETTTGCAWVCVAG